MKIRVVALAMLIAAGPVYGDWDLIHDLYRKEEMGLKYYDRGDFDKAFDYLSQTAVRGLKKSQYIMAFMFMKGQHVDKSALLAMAWLGVAKESRDQEWVDLYESIYDVATPPQRAMIDQKVEEYIARYGMAAQNVQCTRRHTGAGTRRREARCVKVEGPSPVYPMELQPN